MERFWVYLDNKVVGPVEIPNLRKLTGFNLLTQVCTEGQETWKMADEVIEIKAYFSAPPRGSSLTPDSQPELPAEKPQLEMSLPASAVAMETLPPMPQPQGRVPLQVIETLPDLPVVVGNTVAQPNPMTDGLRVSCATCGYKNPRDVSLCMKCGGPLKAAAPAPVGEKPPISLNPLGDRAPKPVGKAEPVTIKDVPTAKIELPDRQPVIPASPMVEIPVARIAMIVGAIALAGTVFFTARHFWKARHHRHAAPLHPVVVIPATPARPTASRRPARATRHQSVSGNKQQSARAALPGLRAGEAAPVRQRSSEGGSRNAEEGSLHEENRLPHSAPRTPNASQGTASYTVLNQAYPLNHRQSAPVDSKYAVKRRGERGLWSVKEEAAIQQAQARRIYGGLRTIRRNSEILMQILRDREYTTAFENGKRLYLFNDVDWAATQKDGPVYEVQLTFSGGKDADGSPRPPLRFAFKTDLERQTVEAGGDGLIKSNTLHAFFDESRIPPEDRRDVAKDTEELILAAQPGASPLALETITKHYAETYSYAALQRIADAYSLTIVNKKLAYQTSSVNEILPKASKTSPTPPTETKPVPVNQPKFAPSMSGSIQYTMVKGQGNDRVVTAIAPSNATPAKLWEAFTSYDRLTQFVPDMLVSQREGQDGPAIIVHTVSLTRLMIFVFKVNLHLRILEHPQQHRLEFERIAGDFEKFSGYAEMKADPTGTRSILEVHVTFAPKGFMPNWALKGMAEHFLVPVLEAIRSKAEAN